MKSWEGSCPQAPPLAPSLLVAQIQLMTVCLTYEYQKTGLCMFSQLNSLNFNIVENDEFSCFEATNDFDFLAP